MNGAFDILKKTALIALKAFGSVLLFVLDAFANSKPDEESEDAPSSVLDHGHQLYDDYWMDDLNNS